MFSRFGKIYLNNALEECEVPEFLTKWQWVDIYREIDFGYNRLLRSLTVSAINLGKIVISSSGKFSTGANVQKTSDDYLEEIYIDGLQAYAGKDWEEAIKLFETIFIVRQDYRDVREKLIEMDQYRKKIKEGEDGKLKALYRQALTAITRESWEDAKASLTKIKDIRDGYLDTEQLLQKVIINLHLTNEILTEKNQKPDKSSTSSEPKFYYSLPSTISIETLGGVSTPIFYKGDSLPARYAEVFTTTADNQERVEIKLFIGENKKVINNIQVAKCNFQGILPAPKGIPKIQTLFVVNRELILDVTATDKATEKTLSIAKINLANFTSPITVDPIPAREVANKNANLNSPSDFTNMYKDIFSSIPNISTPRQENSKKNNQYSPPDFTDLYENIFSSVPTTTPRREAVKGEDIKFKLFIELEDVISGSEKPINLERREECANCKSTGQQRQKACDYCDSKGYLNIKRSLIISIPKGIQTGKKMRLKGRGHCGKGGGKNGDAFAIVEVEQHSLYDRKNDDLYLRYPITELFASQGGKILVPTLTNAIYEMTIPPGIKDKEIIQIEGEGVPHFKKRGGGDLFVVINIFDPREMKLDTKGRLNRINIRVKNQNAHY